MTLAQFMDVSYALLTEEHQRIDPLKDFISVREKLLPSDAKVERVPRQADVKSQNQQSMAMLQGMLSSIPNAPTRKPRRTK